MTLAGVGFLGAPPSCRRPIGCCGGCWPIRSWRNTRPCGGSARSWPAAAS